MVNRFSELRSKEIIHVCEGTRLGYCNDLCIDTGKIGIENAVEMILEYIRFENIL